MTFVFRKAQRENVSLIVGLIGPTGGGKTYSAMRLASGICGDKPFGVICTENRRALHYADQFSFEYMEFKPPFTPARYREAIKAADGKFAALVVDSMSHVWAGDGGVSEMQEAEFIRMKSKDSMKMLSWAKPKTEHKKMVQDILRVESHLILCFRAEEKTKMLKNDRGKVVPTNIGFQPICEKNLPFELTVSLLLTEDAPGVPKPIKLQEQHRPLFPLDKPISEDAGGAINKWAAGGGGGTLQDAIDDITSASTTDALMVVGESLRSMGLSEADKEKANAAYSARMKWIKDNLEAELGGGS